MIEVKDGEVELRARDFLAKRQRVSIEKKKELENAVACRDSTD